MTISAEFASCYEQLPLPAVTYYFVCSRGGNSGTSLLQKSLEQAYERGDVSCPFPQRGLQQVREQSHVGRGNRAGVDL